MMNKLQKEKRRGDNEPGKKRRIYASCQIIIVVVQGRRIRCGKCDTCGEYVVNERTSAWQTESSYDKKIYR